MAALTLTQMQATVAMNCDNLATSDPVYTDSDSLKRYINEAANRVLLMAVQDGKSRRTNFSAFPELQNRVFDAGNTSNSTQSLAVPATCLVPETLTMTKSTAAYSEGSQTEYTIAECPNYDTFAKLPKTATGYPQLWIRSGNNFLFWPTPTTAYLTRVLVRGVRRESDLSAGSDTLLMDYLFHPAVVAEATAITCDALGWEEKSVYWHEKAKQKVGEAISLVGAANRKNVSRLNFGFGR